MKLKDRLQTDKAEEVMRLGSKIYENRIRQVVEPDAHGQFVAIHVDSGEYAVARTSSSAIRAIRATHPPDGRIFLRRISDEPDYGLSMRILAGENAPYRPANSR
jgi:hypothetical protein